MTSGIFTTLSAMRTQIVLLSTFIYFNVARTVWGGVDRQTVLLGAAFFILMQSFYAYDKMIYAVEDRLNGIVPAPGFKWPARLLLLAAFPALLYVISFEPLRWIMILIAIVMPLYSLETPGRFRLKAIPLLKPLLNTALLFSVSVLPPVLLKYGGGWDTIRSAALSSWQLLIFMFSVTVMLDMRDMSGDRAAGILTVPVMLGEVFTAVILCCGLAIAAFSGFRAGNPAVAAPAFIIAVFLIPAVGRKERGYYELFLLALNAFFAGIWIYG